MTAAAPAPPIAAAAGHAELAAMSNFSFLEGASHPEELVARAHELGLAALALTDRNTLAGVVRAHVAAKACGLAFIPGCRLALADGTELLAWPEDRAGYGRLAQLLSRGRMRAKKGACHLEAGDVAGHAAGILFALLPGEGPVEPGALARELGRWRERVGEDALHLALSHRHRGDDRRRLRLLAEAARRADVPTLAVGDVRYHDPARRPLADVLTAIRHRTTVQRAGFLLEKNAERYLKSPAQMARLFAEHPDALARTREVAARCRFSLDELAYNYPDAPVPEGVDPDEHLARLVEDGARIRYPAGVPRKVKDQLAHELALIRELKLARYFLTVHDIVSWARARGILCQGRGSAANSAVCYCLFITAVNPADSDLLFERFVSRERGEPPDIDVDFEHERREEVIQYIYARYGREHAALAATVIRYRARLAVREVGKALGLPADVTARLAATVWGRSSRGIEEDAVREAGLDPRAPELRLALKLAAELIGFPRHLSQHVGGFVLTRDPLTAIVPVTPAAMPGRTVIEWDKDDLDALGILKVDVLALGMLTCIRKAFSLIARHEGRRLDLAALHPMTDPAVYDMLCRGDSLGVFQVESRAQMAMLPRLRPRCFYDLVIEVAIVRPGPIQGEMVHPYLRRRQGLEPVSYPAPHPDHGPPDELKRILGRTLGVPLFQEQAMRIAMVAAGFSGEEANALRRAMATFRRSGQLGRFRDKFISGMVARGYDPAFAARCFRQIEGFGEYGFPESHAASFALLVYASAWLKCHWPAHFACALLNSQPMGFYAPAQIIGDARAHGVEVRPVDVRHSHWDCTLEDADGGGRALRLGMRLVKGLGEEAAQRIVAARARRPFTDIADLARRAAVPRAVLERLAAADALSGLAGGRRQALWAVRAIPAAPALPLFAATGGERASDEPAVALPPLDEAAEMVADWRHLGLSLRRHPLAFLRKVLSARGIRPLASLREAENGARLATAGLVLVRQRPGTARGVVFVTLEDETGIGNLIIWPDLAERRRPVVMGARLMIAAGRISREGEVVHLIAERLLDGSRLLARLMPEAAVRRALAGGPDEARDGTADPVLPPFTPHRHPRELPEVFPKSRDFR
ncbi:MAG: error-prone DNA polymerase 2 [Rhodothalassiaceae bacterium]|nr:MAG: error-prone DNA polymerase 2 [Rhodothalassiaceae bacterium]